VLCPVILSELLQVSLHPVSPPTMKAYLLSTGTIFGLITVAHIWRMIAESAALARDPWFLGLTVLSTALSAWAIKLVRALPKA
jgi:hypothetical protein